MKNVNARIEFRTGYNTRQKEYFVELIDVDTQDNLRCYMNAGDFISIGKDMVEFAAKKENEEWK